MSEETKAILEEETRALGVSLAAAQRERQVAEERHRQAVSAAASAQTALRRAEEHLELAKSQEAALLNNLQASAMRRHVLLAREETA